MATFRYTPLIPTSVEALTITQTLTRLDAVPSTRTFTTATTLTLSKPPATGSSNSHGSSGSPHLSPSAIGAIAGSILGFAIVLTLLYFCCRSPSEDDLSYSENLSEHNRYRSNKAGAEEPTRHRSHRPVVVTAEGELAHARPPRRRRSPAMNRASSASHVPNISLNALAWFAGSGRSYDA